MKKLNKILSVLLCCILVWSLAVPALAQSESKKYPTVYVPGIATSQIYADLNDTSHYIDVPSNDVIVDIIKNDVLPALIVYAANKDIDRLGRVITSSLNEALEEWFINPDGSLPENSGVINQYPAVISKNSRLVFRYDWRADPFVLASQLNDYINYVLQTSKCDKVALPCHSLGAIVVLTYLTVYGSDKVYGVVMDSPAIEGVSYVADLLCGEIDLTSDAVLTFLKGTLDENEYEELIVSSLDILEMAGVSDLVIDALDDVIKMLSPMLFEETLLPIFGRWLSIWAMVPEERVDEAMEFVFEGDYAKDKDLSALKAKVENYNNNVRKNRKDTLLNFDEEARVAVISRYGHTCFPVTTSWELMGDAVIETSSSSLGAVTAPLGEYFSEEYLADKDMKYISPDKTIDASTCLFPEKTWFIKGVLHEETDYTHQIVSQILFYEEEANCDNFPMERFTVFNEETEDFDTDETVPQKPEKLTPMQRLYNFLKALFKKLFQLFAK